MVDEGSYTQIIKGEIMMKGNSITLSDGTVGVISAVSPHKKFVIVEFKKDGNTRNKTVFMSDIKTHGSEHHEVPSS